MTTSHSAPPPVRGLTHAAARRFGLAFGGALVFVVFLFGPRMIAEPRLRVADFETASDSASVALGAELAAALPVVLSATYEDRLRIFGPEEAVEGPCLTVGGSVRVEGDRAYVSVEIRGAPEDPVLWTRSDVVPEAEAVGVVLPWAVEGVRRSTGRC
jgi:hypothetical protein